MPLEKRIASLREIQRELRNAANDALAASNMYLFVKKATEVSELLGKLQVRVQTEFVNNPENLHIQQRKLDAIGAGFEKTKAVLDLALTQTSISFPLRVKGIVGALGQSRSLTDKILDFIDDFSTVGTPLSSSNRQAQAKEEEAA